MVPRCSLIAWRGGGIRWRQTPQQSCPDFLFRHGSKRHQERDGIPDITALSVGKQLTAYVPLSSMQLLLLLLRPIFPSSDSFYHALRHRFYFLKRVCKRRSGSAAEYHTLFVTPHFIMLRLIMATVSTFNHALLIIDRRVKQRARIEARQQIICH